MPKAEGPPRLQQMHAEAPSADGSLTGAHYQALADFRHALRQFLAFSEEAANGAGLTAQQHQALLSIRGAPGGAALGVNQLAGRLLISRDAAAELVDWLQQAGLVSHGQNGDGRSRIVLTAKAEAILHSLSLAHMLELKAVRPIFHTLLRQLD